MNPKLFDRNELKNETYAPPRLSERAEAAVSAIPVNISSSLTQALAKESVLKDKKPPTRMPGWRTNNYKKKL